MDNQTKEKVYQILNNNFHDILEVQKKFQQVINQSLINITELTVNTITNNNKILLCGNGGSAADCQHFAAELIGRFEKEKIKGHPAIALTTDTSILTAIANDYSFEQIFSKQIEALGQENDLLIAITTSGNSKNIIKAIESALQKNMKVLLLSGKNGGLASQINDKNCIKLIVPSTKTSLIQQNHLLFLHIICEIIDELLL